MNRRLEWNKVRTLCKKLGSIFVLAVGILLTLLGVAGLFLPIIPGFVLILVGVWMIGKVYKSPLLDRILVFAQRQRERMTKTTFRKEKD